MRLDELPQSERIEDRRGRSSRVPGGRGSIGIGTIVVLGLIGWALGIDPPPDWRRRDAVRKQGTQQQADVGSETKTGAPPDEMGRFVSAVLGSTEVQWADIFAQSGMPTNRQRSSCFPAQHNPAAGLRNPRWARSIARWIKRSIWTQVSFRILSDGFVRATPAVKPASSPRPT